MIVATHNHQGNNILCVTDSDILGKKYVEGKKQIDLTSDFYSGKEKNKEEVKELTKKAYVIHFTGKKSVAIGIEMDLVKSGHILTIKGIPHAEVVVEKD